MTPSRVVIAVAGALVALILTAPSVAKATVHQAAREGDELWVDRYDPLDGYAVGLYPIAAPDGETLYAVGAVGDGEAGYRIVAFDAATGEHRWVAEQTDGREMHAAVLSPDGARMYLAGIIRTDAVTYQDWAIVAIDTSTGDELWSARHNAIGRRDIPTGIAAAPDGAHVFVTGETVRSKGSVGMETIALESETGETAWAELYDGPSRAYDSGVGVVVSPVSDEVYVTGWSSGRGTGEDYATIAYDAATGDRRWLTRYDGPGEKRSHDLPDSIVIAPDGDAVYVTGQSTNANRNPDYFTAAYATSDGDELWHDRFRRAPRSEDQPYSMAMAPDGERVYVTGGSWKGENEDAVTIAYATADGRRAWRASYDGPEHREDLGWDVVASPDGRRVYVTVQATFQAKRRPDFLTISYGRKKGAVKWSARYGGPRLSVDNLPTVDVAPDSERVYVVGRESTGDGAAFTTIAYEPPR